MADNFSSRGWSWSGAWSFFKSELSPYPGRARLVARMTMAATIMMLCIMTFRLPGAALGAYYTLVISRDSTHATVESSLTLLGAISIALAEVLFGAIAFAGSPLLHFLWVVASLFAIFFLISAATRYNFATSFGFLVSSTIPIWDFPVNPDRAVSNTLYAALSVSLAALITVAVEVVSASVHSADLIQEGVDDRLRIAAEYLRNVREPAQEIKSKLRQYGDIGTGYLRRLLTRTESGQDSYPRRAVMIALAGRLIDLSAGLLASTTSVTEREQEQLTRTAARIDEIREFGTTSQRHRHEHAPLKPAGAGFLQFINSTVELMDDALEQPELMNEYIAPEDFSSPPVLKRDAFSNPAHLKFAFRGTAAALLCYLAYHFFDWRGLNSSVATCMITALSTTGSSRQKQILRVAGAIIGGLILAIGAEVFLLPYIDSIAEFTLLFVAVTVLSGWFATSNPRLSYFGLQMAFAFYVVHLRTFAPETQLTPARDNVVGILLGLVVMWVVFDQLAPHNSMLEMKQNLVRAVRMVVAYMSEKQVTPRREYLKRVRGFRDAVNDSFGSVRANADAVLFEFGPSRKEALKLRSEVRAWQPQIRTLFLLQTTLAHMRLREPNGVLPQDVERCQDVCAQVLNELAQSLECGLLGAEPDNRLELKAESMQAQLTQTSVAGTLAADSLVIATDLLKQVRGAMEELAVS